MGPSENPYDRLATLVVRAKAGDHEAFRELYQRTAQAQYFIISAKVDAEAAADILQEVYMIAWQNIADIQPRSFLGYLRTVSHNACLRHYDRMRRSRETTLARDDVTSLDQTVMSGRLADSASDPAVVAESLDERTRLARALREELDEREREVILLRFYQEMRIDDIAQALDISASTVKRDIRSALGKLRARLGTLPRQAVFPLALANAVENPLAEGVLPKSRKRRVWPPDWAVRGMAAASALIVIGCLGAMLNMERPETFTVEFIEEAPVPAVETPSDPPAPTDVTGPELTSLSTERGSTVLVLTDESGVADVRLADDDGTIYSASSSETLAEPSNATAYRFDVPSGTYTVTATDTLGNIAEGSITVTLPPQEPVSASSLA